MAVNISSYSGSVVAGDWSPAVKAAFDAIKATGGTINIDTDITVKSNIDMSTSPAAPVPIYFVGDGSKLVTVDGGASTYIFVGGNLQRLSFHRVDMIGSGSDADAGGVLGGAYIEQLSVTECTLAGLKAGNVVGLGAGGTCCVDKCLIGGGSHTAGAIEGAGMRHLSVKNTKCIDYDNLRGVYRSKTPDGVNAWIKCVGAGSPAGDSSSSSLLEVENFISDEGAEYQIYAKDMERVVVNGASGNVSGGGYGIYLENVRGADLRNLWYGYTAIDRPAVKLVNCGDVSIENLQVGQGVKRIEVDSNTRLTYRNCPGVVISRV